jgi:hypothetical protein
VKYYMHIGKFVYISYKEIILLNDTTLTEFLCRLEKSLFRSVEGKTAAEIEAIINDEFVEFGSSGHIYNKKQAVEAISQTSDEKIVIKNFNAMELSREVILVTYIAVKYLKEGGNGEHSLRSSLWKFIEGKWQIVFHQGTALNPDS